LEFIVSKRLKKGGEHLKITFYYAEDTTESGAMLRFGSGCPNVSVHCPQDMGDRQEQDFV
jgi:hypothetical protein